MENVEVVNVDPVSRAVVVRQVEKEANVYLLKARSVVVNSVQEYEEAGREWNAGRKFLALIEAERKKGTDPLRQVIAQITSWFSPMVDSTSKGMELYEKAMKVYDDKSKQVAAEEQRRLQAEADKKAKALEEKAKKAAEKGDEAKAEQLRQEAMLKASIVAQVEVSTPKVSGIRTSTTYYGEVTDKKVFIDWCIKTENYDLLLPNVKEITAIAKRSKGTRVIPGVKFWSEESLSGARE